MTTVKVDVYKESRKWYVDEEFQTELNPWDSSEIEALIEKEIPVCQYMSYTWEASAEGKGINKRMVIHE